MLPFIRKVEDLQIKTIKWITDKPILAVLGQKTNRLGVVYLYKLEKENLSKYAELQVNGDPTTLSMLMGDLVVAEGKLITIWSLDNLKEPKCVIDVGMHIDCMDSFGGSYTELGPPEIVVGCGNKVLVYDVRVQEPVVTINEKQTIWAVGFGNAYSTEEKSIAVGFSDGLVKLYDLNLKKLVWSLQLKQGICRLEFNCKTTKQHYLSIGCLKGLCYVIDIRDLKKVVTVEDKNDEQECTIWSLGHSPHYKEALLISNDNYLQLFKIGTNKLTLMDSVGHLSEQPIRALDWNTKMEGLCAICSFDQVISILMIPAIHKCK